MPTTASSLLHSMRGVCSEPSSRLPVTSSQFRVPNNQLPEPSTQYPAPSSQLPPTTSVPSFPSVKNPRRRFRLRFRFRGVCSEPRSRLPVTSSQFRVPSNQLPEPSSQLPVASYRPRLRFLRFLLLKIFGFESDSDGDQE